MWKHWCPCMALCMCPSHLISVPTPCLECVHASVHVLMSTWVPHSASFPLHSYMEHGFQCVVQCVCSSQSTSVPTPWLESVHASVHVFMSTWLPISPKTPMHSYMETWVSQCGPVCVLPIFCSHTLFTMCTCISTWINIHLTAPVCSTPHEKFDGNMGAPVWHCAFVTITLLLVTQLD